ncbi:MAG TPA: aa3-type cytochrome c oxidase subunit IV [Alphaproteobacteria bacterium]|nr:aa3-type cytochrome c oxidase subunit IV [Alphaproteobacteria bacterium]
MTVDHDLEPHLETWHSFVRMIFYGLAFVVSALGLMALFLL